MSFNVSVEGNIGSGKSTFLKYLETQRDVAVFQEPLDLWRDCDGHNLLALLYEDPHKWGFACQTYLQNTMINRELDAARNSRPIKIFERSLESGIKCFTKKMFVDGIISKTEYDILVRMYRNAISRPEMKIHRIVYLRTSPEIAYRRVLNRGREEESSVTLELLQNLNRVYEEWINEKSSERVTIIDGDLEDSAITREYDKCLENIRGLNQLDKSFV